MSGTKYTPFPKRILSEKKKKGAYTLAWGEAILASYEGSTNAYINSNLRDKFKLFKQYATGNQPESLYKDHFSLERENKSGSRKGVTKLNFNIVPYGPRFLDVTISLLSEVSNRTNVVFLDDSSSDEKKKLKNTLKAKGELQEFIKDVNDSRGVETTESSEFIPGSKKELDAYETEGGIKLDLEDALEKGIQYVLDYDVKWGKRISGDLKADLFTLGVGGVRDYIDPVTNTIKIRKEDMDNFVIDGSREYDFSDAQFAGTIRELTVLDVYNGYKKTMGKTLTEAEIIAIAEGSTISTTDQNIDLDDSWYDAPMKQSLQRYMPTRVKVLDFIYKSVDIIEGPTKKGKKVTIKSSIVKKSELKKGTIKWDGTRYYKLVDKVSTKIEAEVWRRGKLIIGTEITYDFGLVENQVRDEALRPISPVHISRTRTNSIISKIIPNLDALQIDMMHIQNRKANMRGYGLAISIEALTNIKIGTKDYDAKEILKLQKLEGTLLYKQQASGLGASGKYSGSPIQEIQGGMGPAYDQLMNDITFNVQQIQMTTGLNEVALAQNPNPEVTATQAGIALKGSNNAISNIYDAYKNIKEEVAYSIGLRLQYLANKFPNHPVYTKVIGKKLWKILGDSDKKVLARNEVKIIDGPSEAQINEINKNISIALQQQTIDLHDSFLLTAMVDEGKPLRLISGILKSKIEKVKSEAQEAAQANQQAQQEFSKEMEEFKKEFEAFKMDMEYKKDSKLLHEKAEEERKTNEANDIVEKREFGGPIRNNS